MQTVVDFGRVLTAMVTPFAADGEVNYGVVHKLAVHLAEHGTDTLVVCGTTGESPTLSWDEEYRLFQAVREAVEGKAKVIAGTGSNSTREAVMATEKAAKLGLDGTLQVVPYYNKPPQEGLYQHFKAIAEASDLPMLLYNIPGRTGCNLEPETVAHLAEMPNIVAIKEASGNLDQVSQIRRLTPRAFAIYSGDDSLTLPLMAVGARGVVSVASHLVGDQLQQMVTSFEREPALAIRLHLQLFPLFKALFLTTNPVMVKTALQMQGWPVGEVRLPLSSASESHCNQLRSVLTDLKLL